MVGEGNESLKNKKISTLCSLLSILNIREVSGIVLGFAILVK